MVQAKILNICYLILIHIEILKLKKKILLNYQISRDHEKELITYTSIKLKLNKLDGIVIAISYIF